MCLVTFEARGSSATSDLSLRLFRAVGSTSFANVANGQYSQRRREKLERWQWGWDSIARTIASGLYEFASWQQRDWRAPCLILFEVAKSELFEDSNESGRTTVIFRTGYQAMYSMKSSTCSTYRPITNSQSWQNRYVQGHQGWGGDVKCITTLRRSPCLDRTLRFNVSYIQKMPLIRISWSCESNMNRQLVVW